jgi:hypothetical protein
MFGIKARPREASKQINSEKTKNESVVGLTKEKAVSKHLKHFNEGIHLFYQGVICPTESNAIKDGWLCAEKMLETKNQALLASQKRFNLD